MISSNQNEEMSNGIDEMEAELDAGGNVGITGFFYALRKFRKDCENFATIAKIRYHSESYCTQRKFEFSLCLVFSL